MRLLSGVKNEWKSAYEHDRHVVDPPPPVPANLTPPKVDPIVCSCEPDPPKVDLRLFW